MDIVEQRIINKQLSMKKVILGALLLLSTVSFSQDVVIIDTEGTVNYSFKSRSVGLELTLINQYNSIFGIGGTVPTNSSVIKQNDTDYTQSKFSVYQILGQQYKNVRFTGKLGVGVTEKLTSNNLTASTKTAKMLVGAGIRVGTGSVYYNLGYDTYGGVSVGFTVSR